MAGSRKADKRMFGGGDEGQGTLSPVVCCVPGIVLDARDKRANSIELLPSGARIML